MKLTKKLGLSIFFTANEASEGILGEFLIILRAISFKESNKATDSLETLFKLFSSNSSIEAIK